MHVINHELHDTAIEAIWEARSVRVIDDTSWNNREGCFSGSLLWNGLPTSLSLLQRFGEFVKRQTDGGHFGNVDGIVGISSSGLAWGAAASLAVCRDLVPIRLVAHRYGPWNSCIEGMRGKRIVLIDNYMGSGETIRQAEELLRGYHVTTILTIVTERFAETQNVRVASPIAAGLESAEKLRALLAIGYFQKSDEEVVHRILDNPRGYLADINWVRKVKAAMRD